MHPAIIDHTYRITYHAFLLFCICQEIWETSTQFANFLLAWHSFTKTSSPAILVGLVAFHHRLNRKQRSQSPPFALCTYTRCVDCSFWNGATRRQRSTKVCSTLSWYRAIIKFKSSLACENAKVRIAPHKNLLTLYHKISYTHTVSVTVTK